MPEADASLQVWVPWKPFQGMHLYASADSAIPEPCIRPSARSHRSSRRGSGCRLHGYVVRGDGRVLGRRQDARDGGAQLLARTFSRDPFQPAAVGRAAEKALSARRGGPPAHGGGRDEAGPVRTRSRPGAEGGPHDRGSRGRGTYHKGLPGQGDPVQNAGSIARESLRCLRRGGTASNRALGARINALDKGQGGGRINELTPSG
jgi:hypothetical protein